MSDMDTLRGVIAPILTPFDDNGEADPARYLAHAKWLLAEGCTGLAPFGTTGEATSLGFEERLKLLEALVDGGIDPAKLLAGVGTPSLPDTVALTRHAVSLGCGGVMMLPPYYYKAVSEEGLFRYMAAVIERVADSRLKVYLYHIPPVAVVGWSAALVGRLIEAFPGIVVGLKDSSGDWANTQALLEAYPGFAVFPGSEIYLLQGLRAGGAGCITATGNVNPAGIRKVYDAWQGPEAEALQEQATAVRKAIQARPMIPTLKAIVAHYRNDPGWARLRPPFVPLAAEEARVAVAELEAQHGFRLAA